MLCQCGPSAEVKVAVVGGVGLAAAAYSFTAAGFVACLRVQELSTGLFAAFVAGGFVGQLGFGDLACRYGRSVALLGSAGLMLTGSVLCAAAGCLTYMFGQGDGGVGIELGTWLFVLGIGFGGECPAAVSYIVEHTAAHSQSLAGAHFFIGIGHALGSVVHYVVVSAHVPNTMGWRISFAMNGVVSLLALLVRHCWVIETPLFIEQNSSPARLGSTGLVLVCRSIPYLWRALLSTSAAWFLHGFAINDFLTVWLPFEQDFQRFLVTQLVVALVCLPSYAAVVLFVRRSRRSCQLIGFAALTAVLLSLALISGEGSPGLYMALVCMLRVLDVGGPAATVYFVPAEVFPTCVRTVCIGLSAAAGGVGSVLGAGAWHELFQLDVPRAAYAISAAVAGIGVGCTAYLTPKYNRQMARTAGRLTPGNDIRGSTIEALENGAQFRQCPGCEVMVERSGGCNVITCANCQDAWCFVCGGHDCQAWACSGLERRSPDLESLTRLLWPRASEDRCVLLVDRQPADSG